jgi:hypothetical protein
VRDSAREKNLDHSARNEVLGTPPPTPQDEGHYIGCPLGEPAARSVLPCRMKFGLSYAKPEPRPSGPCKQRGSSQSPGSPVREVAQLGLIWALAGAWRRHLSAALPTRVLCSSHLCFFLPIATTIICSAVTSAAAALILLHWSDILPRWLGIPAIHTLRCIAAVALRVTKTMAASA